MSNPLNGILGSSGGGSGGSGDVVGPASSTDNAIARFDGTTGKLIQNSGVTVADGLTGSVVVGSTGATDDAILVADGTGGSTLAATNVFIDSSSVFRLGGANSNNYPALRPKSDNSGTFEIVKAASPVSAWGNLSTEGGRVSASLISNASSAAASTVTIYGSASLLQLGTGAGVAWTNNTSSESGSLDTGLARSAAGVVKVTDGGAGAGSLEITDAAAISAAGVRGSTKTTYGLSIGSSGGTDFSSLVANATPILGVSSTHVFLHTLVPLLWTHGGIGSGSALGLYPTTGYGDNRDLLTVAYGSTPRAILSAVRLEANTAGSGTPNAIAATESGTVFTNEGTTAKNYHSLPTAAAGYAFEFACQDADGIRITANTGDTIRVIDKVTAAAGYIESTTIGSVVRLVSINATEWFAMSIHGVWTDGTWTYDDTSLTTP